MFKLIKQLFCNHVFKYDHTIKSMRYGEDNHVIECTICECGKINISEKLVKIEKDYYRR